MQISEVERCCVRMNNNLIVDDLKITVNPEMMTSLKELSKYKPTKHEDDIAMFMGADAQKFVQILS